MKTSTDAPRFLPAGETALVVEFGTIIDPAIHERVLAFDRALTEAKLEGVIESVPTYRSVMVHYDPTLIEPQQLLKTLRALPAEVTTTRKSRRWIVPICYAPSFAEDLDYVAQSLGLTPERVVMLHSGAAYRIYM
jgi:allophanate hydrolase subunit 1